jgi:hypothetical protein
MTADRSNASLSDLRRIKADLWLLLVAAKRLHLYVVQTLHLDVCRQDSFQSTPTPNSFTLDTVGMTDNHSIIDRVSFESTPARSCAEGGIQKEDLWYLRDRRPVEKIANTNLISLAPR